VIEEQNESVASSMVTDQVTVNKRRYVCKAARDIDSKVLKVQFAGFISVLNKALINP
jgi:hypothetical protein